MVCSGAFWSADKCGKYRIDPNKRNPVRENFLKEEKTVVSKACLFEMQTLFLKSGAGLQEHLWEGQCCVTMLSEHE